MKKLKVLPPMKCETACGECCGIAPATEAEYRRVLAVARSKKLTIKNQGATCPFYQEGTCQVYDARPFACRLFGHVERMTCPRGHNVNVPDDAARRMVMKNGFPTRVLHEALIEFGICQTIEEAVGTLDDLPDDL